MKAKAGEQLDPAAGGLRLDSPPIVDWTFACASPKIDDLSALLGSAFFCLVPASADFVMRVEIQAAAELNLTGEIQRLYHNALAAELGGLHIGEPHKGYRESLTAGRLPGKFTRQNPGAHIKLPGEIREFRPGQIEAFAVHPQARIQPVHRVEHGRALRNKAFEYLVVVNIHHFIQMVEVAAQQVVAAIAFFKIATYAHEFVGYRKTDSEIR